MVSNYFILYGCVLVGLVSSLVSSLPTSTEWHQFKRQFGKQYSGRTEEATRRALFERNRAFIADLNAKHSGQVQFELNHLSDISDHEYSQMNGVRIPASLVSDLQSKPVLRLEQLISQGGDLPKEVDWRKVEGRVSDIKDQHQCGSCWAFSTTGALEGQELNAGTISGPNETLVALSEQDLLDCSKKNHGCQGGLPMYALEDVRGFGGIMSEYDYPYRAELGNHCLYSQTHSLMSNVDGYELLAQADDQALMAAVATRGPVSVCIHSTLALKQYAKGVFDDKTCSNKMEDLNHAVLVVGYGTDAKEGDYWIIKNSWSIEWGEDGYVRMARGPNQCGISLIGVLPKLATDIQV